MDKILRIDMNAEGGPKATIQPLGDYAGLGGRAMTSLVPVWNRTRVRFLSFRPALARWQ